MTLKIKARIQKPIQGKHGGWLSVVNYPVSKSSGYSITGEVEWVHMHEAVNEAKQRVQRAKETGVAQ